MESIIFLITVDERTPAEVTWVQIEELIKHLLHMGFSKEEIKITIK